MAGLFLNMMKEEWRIHSTMFGSLNFALFPVMILAIAFMGTFLLPLISSTMPVGDLVILVHANYLMLGFMVGAFGLLGNEVMNRRFGQASLLAFSARTLPLTERYIFTIFVLKDTLYYFILWIFPLGAGFFLGSLFTEIPVIYPVRLLITLTLSFLSGMSIVFLLSSIYGRSQRALIIFLLLSGCGVFLYIFITAGNPVKFFPPLNLFYHFSWDLLVVSIITILVPFIIALLLFSPDVNTHAKVYPGRMNLLLRYLGWMPNRSLVAKDLIDIWRSGGILGQTIFSFLVPLVIIWFFLTLLDEYVSILPLLFTFAIITGIIASTMYTWLTMFDSLSIYALLPVDVHAVISGKIATFFILQIIPVVFISIITIISAQSVYLLPILVITLSVSFYVLSVTIWLTGLAPSILVYSVRVMIIYFLLIGVVMAIFSSLTAINPLFGLAGVFLLLPSWFFIRLGFSRWDRVEQEMY
jgi:hypothetical protein